MWRIWAKALGEKYGRTDREADTIAGIRTLIFVSYLVTNLFIISGVIRHWNSKTTCIPLTSLKKTSGIQTTIKTIRHL